MKLHRLYIEAKRVLSPESQARKEAKMKVTADNNAKKRAQNKINSKERAAVRATQRAALNAYKKSERRKAIEAKIAENPPQPGKLHSAMGTGPNKISQKSLAKKLGVDRTTVCRWASAKDGVKRTPLVQNLRLLKSKGGFNVVDIFLGDD